MSSTPPPSISTGGPRRLIFRVSTPDADESTAPPGGYRCRCTVGGCTTFKCTLANHFCISDCLCIPDACNNRRPDEPTVRPEPTATPPQVVISPQRVVRLERGDETWVTVHPNGAFAADPPNNPRHVSPPRQDLIQLVIEEESEHESDPPSDPESEPKSEPQSEPSTAILTDGSDQEEMATQGGNAAGVIPEEELEEMDPMIRAMQMLIQQQQRQYADEARRRDEEMNRREAAIQQRYERSQDVLTQRLQQLQQQQRTGAAADTAALVERLVTVIRPPTVDSLDKDQFFGGQPSESLSSWLRLLEQKAVREGWNHAARRNAPIRSLKPGSRAEEWQNFVGVEKPTWTDWQRAIKLAFGDDMSPLQWAIMVEARKQKKGETGASYVLDKVSLLRRRVETMDEDETIDYLTRGLFNENHKSVMMGKTINSLDEYLVEINRLEKKSSPTVTMSEIASLGILVAQGEDQPLPTARTISSKEPVDAGESDLTLPGLAKMIGRLTSHNLKCQILVLADSILPQFKMPDPSCGSFYSATI